MTSGQDLLQLPLDVGSHELWSVSCLLNRSLLPRLGLEVLPDGLVVALAVTSQLNFSALVGNNVFNIAWPLA